MTAKPDMALLPAPFADLEPFVADWARDDFQQRNHQRFTAGMDSVRTFYEALAPRADEIMTCLEGFPLEDVPADAANLYKLLMALAHVTLSVEHHGQLAPPGTEFNPAVRVIDGPSPA